VRSSTIATRRTASRATRATARDHHVEALLREGPCDWHRRSFAPLRLMLAGEQLSLDMFMDGAIFIEDELEPEVLDPEE